MPTDCDYLFKVYRIGRRPEIGGIAKMEFVYMVVDQLLKMGIWTRAPSMMILSTDTATFQLFLTEKLSE